MFIYICCERIEKSNTKNNVSDWIFELFYVLLWTPTHDRAKAGRPARTYIQQLCEDTGCCPEDLPRAMNDREEWRERIKDIRATITTWWWWWWWSLANISFVYVFIQYSITRRCWQKFNLFKTEWNCFEL